MITRWFQKVCLFSALACLTACFGPFASSEAPPPRAGIAAREPAADVILFGRLMPRRTTGIAGATVAVYEILPDNRLLPVVDHVVQTETDGSFRARIRLDGTYRGPLLVRADCEFGYGMVLVSDIQVVNEGIAALPITDATTVQAQIYLTAREQHLWPESLDVVHLHRFIGESLARAALLEGDHAQVTVTLARAVTAAAISFEQTLRDAPGGLSAHDWQRARTAMHGAYFALADELYHASDAEAVSNATHAFEDRMAAAQVGPEGYPAPAWTIASQAALDAFLPYVDALPPSVRIEAVLHLERGRGRDVVDLMAHVPHADAEVKQKVGHAGEQLLAALAGLQGDREAVDGAARDAWAAYQAAIGQVLPQLVEPGQEAALGIAVQDLDRQAVAATAQLRRLDAAADPAVTARLAGHQVCGVFAAAHVPAAPGLAEAPAAAAARDELLEALGSISLARLR